jgi:AcrR family transcriptional regulator
MTSSTADPRAGTVRMSADERRAAVVRAALTEFARGGLHGTSTEAIARRVGVSQPYLFRLFPNKKALFLAAAEHGFTRIGEFLEQAADGTTGHEAMHRMAASYQDLLAGETDILVMQLHMYAAAAQDPEIREAIRVLWDGLERRCREVIGGSDDEMTTFLARGMLCNVISALDLPRERYFEHPPGPEGEGCCPMCDKH